MKAILVIDVPADYAGSVISVNLYGRNNKVIQEIHTNKLRLLPQKIEVEVNDIEDIMHTDFSIENLCAKIRLDTDKLFSLGWNACLDEILGETE